MIDSKKSLIIEVEGMNSIKDFVIANEEIAAQNMRRIRDAVVSRRDFLVEITQLYKQVRRSYKQEVQNILAHMKKPSVSLQGFVKKNDKTVCVLLSTNASLYGDLVKNTYSLFRETLGEKKVDVVIVGKVGKRVFEEENPGVEYKFFDFPDTTIESDLLKPLILHIIQYETVVVFHSKFETLVRQTPTAFVISESSSDASGSVPEVKYFFEPSLENVIEYFEKEIFSSIFEQTMHESDLSKYAARMVTLDAATDNINEKLSQLVFRQKLLDHQKKNKDQVNALSRVLLWSKRR